MNNDVKGSLWISQVAVGEENNFKISIPIPPLHPDMRICFLLNNNSPTHIYYLVLSKSLHFVNQF